MMYMIKLSVLCVLFLSSNAQGFFSYDRAASLMEQEKWQEAKQQLKTLLVDKPDSPDILYDAGVASYKTKDLKQAAAYFKRVTDLPQTKIELKEQAYFNAGNTSAALKEYDEAIKQFNEVLNINPANEKAKKNIEQVKLLKQQKQKQENEKNKKDDKKNDDKKDSENKENSETEQKDNQKNEQDQSSNGQDQKKQMSQDGDQKREQKEGNEQEQEGEDKPQDQGQAQDGKEEKQAHQAEQEKKRHEEKPLKEDERAQEQGTGSEKKIKMKKGKRVLHLKMRHRRN